MKLAESVPKNDCILCIKTEDGQTGLFDTTPYLESDAFTPPKKRCEFERFHNGKYFIEWDCGADLSADTIQARWKPVIQANAQQNAPADAAKAPRP